MVDTFFEKAGESFKTLSPEKQKEVMILASIIEKEGKKDSERPIIASVFTNRLAKKILLESCATVIYAFEKKGIQKKRLLYRDLKIKSPFNTYLYPGLPPSPISSFGTVSLHAAMNPAETDYLYFVYKGNGEHIFTKTLKEHMAAYRQYILYQTQRK
ncbi:MAG TPA: endolytic transglycosylase MltG [Spirochaetia bacterium]|nr:endolytic transglycosylase MltG [Spirochaetia bacterium]